MTAASPLPGHIRSFTAEDIPQVADLHRRVFKLADQTSPELLDAYRTYFTQVYLNNPCQDDDAGSLVYEEKSERITGFLAMAPRRMSMNGRAVRAKITSQFVVDPNSRGFAGLQLLKAALAGPQDITIADESNGDSRILWEGLGGVTSYLYSMRWFYPLRPCQFGLFVVRRKKFLPPFLAAASAPVARTLDALAGRIVKSPTRSSGAQLVGEDLDCQTLSACLSEAGKKQSMRPDYDHHSLNWLLQRAEQLRSQGRLQKVLLRTAKREIAGWYLYYLNPAGLSEVIQIQAKAHFAHDVLEHLFHDARRQGAIVLSGRMEPSMMQAFSDTHCIFHCGPEWVLIHSRRPELLQAFDRGNMGFSRLDGEWCLHFR
jgi:hypothetical protein